MTTYRRNYDIAWCALMVIVIGTGVIPIASGYPESIVLGVGQIVLGTMSLVVHLRRLLRGESK